MREGWEACTLGDILSLEYGRALPERTRDGHGFPVYGSAGVVGWHSAPIVHRGPVLIVGRKGTAGSVTWSETSCSPIDTTYFVQVKRDISLAFVYALLIHLDLPSITAQTGVPGLNRDRAYELPVVLPPAHEQHRIVDLMSAVDAYVAAADARVEATRVARSALLSDLLSKPGEDWVETTLGDIASVDRGASWSKSQERFESSSESVPVLRIGNVQLDGIELDDVLHIEGLRYKPTQSIVGRKTIVMVGSNGNPKRVGNSFLASADTDGFVFASFLIGITASPQIRPALLCSILQSKSVQEAITLATSGSTGLKNIGLGWLRSLPLSIPPSHMQETLEELISSVESSVTAATGTADAARAIRTAILRDLLSGNHEIPTSYDRFLKAA